MRPIHSVGIALTVTGLVGLMLPPTTPAAHTAQGLAGVHALAVSAGSDLRLVALHELGSMKTNPASSIRTLACAGVLRLGTVEIGYRCGAHSWIGSIAARESALPLGQSQEL
jgi:hypothetical protein